MHTQDLFTSSQNDSCILNLFPFLFFFNLLCTHEGVFLFSMHTSNSAWHLLVCEFFCLHRCVLLGIHACVTLGIYFVFIFCSLLDHYISQEYYLHFILYMVVPKIYIESLYDLIGHSSINGVQ